MGLVLTATKLASRIARTDATKGLIRKFLPSAGLLAGRRGSVRELDAWNGFLKFAGGLLNETWKILSGATVWTATKIWDLTVASFEAVMNFNWNPSDAELDNTIKNAFNNLAGLAGGFLGKATGYVVCGALPGMVVFSFNEALGARLLTELGEEALPELASSLANLIKTIFGATGNAFFAWTHKNIRTLWRETDDKFKARLAKNGMKIADVEKALAERNKPYTFRGDIDQKVAGIKSQSMREFTEQFLEEFNDTCVESGYVIAGGIDAYAAEKAMAQDIGRGESTNIEVITKEDGTIILEQFKRAKAK